MSQLFSHSSSHHPQGCLEEYAVHLAIKVIQICSALDSGLGAGPAEAVGLSIYMVIWEELDPVESEESL